MGMVAKPGVSAATDDMTDTDDGNATVSAGDFWPEIALRDLRLAMRLPGRTTTSRLMHAATEAVAHVTGELEDWQAQQEANGFATLATVPARNINGGSIHVYRYQRAVYAATRAFILENARDVDTTEKGDRKADALDAQTNDLWRDVRWAISDIRGVQRIYAELC